MGHEYALKIEELNRELVTVREKHYKLKNKTTKNMLQALHLKREISRIETEIACNRTYYINFRKNLENKQRGKI